MDACGYHPLISKTIIEISGASLEKGGLPSRKRGVAISKGVAIWKKGGCKKSILTPGRIPPRRN